MSEKVPPRTPGIKGQKPSRILVQPKAPEQGTNKTFCKQDGESLTDKRRTFGKPQRILIGSTESAPRKPLVGLRAGPRRVLLPSFEQGQDDSKRDAAVHGAKTPIRKAGAAGTGAGASMSRARTVTTTARPVLVNPGPATGAAKTKTREVAPFWASTALKDRNPEVRRLDMRTSPEPAQQQSAATGAGGADKAAVSRATSSIAGLAPQLKITSTASYRYTGVPAGGGGGAAASRRATSGASGNTALIASASAASSLTQVLSDGNGDNAASPAQCASWTGAGMAGTVPLPPSAQTASHEAPMGCDAEAAVTLRPRASLGGPSMAGVVPLPPGTSAVSSLESQAQAGEAASVGADAEVTTTPRTSRTVFSRAVFTPLALALGASPQALATPVAYRTPLTAHEQTRSTTPSQPTLGSVTSFSQVKAKRALRAQLGNDTVVTPVRRSARKSHCKPTPTVTALLEATKYSYAPNTYLA